MHKGKDRSGAKIGIVFMTMYFSYHKRKESMATPNFLRPIMVGLLRYFQASGLAVNCAISYKISTVMFWFLPNFGFQLLYSYPNILLLIKTGLTHKQSIISQGFVRFFK